MTAAVKISGTRTIQSAIPPESYDPPRLGAFERLLLSAARGLVVVVLLAAPWALGGVEPEVQWYLYAGIVLSLTCCLISLLPRILRTSGDGIAIPTTLLPLVGGLILGTLHLLPLNEPVQTTVGSQNSALVVETGQLSLYPASTRFDLSRLTFATIAFLLGVFLFRNLRHQVWLWCALALSAAALALLGMTQKLGPHVDIFDWVPQVSNTPFASYINKNNAAGYLNLGFAACIGLLACSMRGTGLATAATAHSENRTRRKQSTQTFLGKIAGIDGGHLFPALMAVVIMAGVFCSLSRGGMIALAASLLVAVAVVGVRKHPAAALTIGVAALVLSFALLGWLQLDSEVKQQANTLISGQAAEDSRLPHWNDARRAAPAASLSGAGLGTYRYVYLPHQQRLAESWFYHAENQYLEALIEGGVIGLALLLTTIGLVVIASRQLLLSEYDPRLQAIGVAGLVALTGQAVHAVVDFGLYLPANMLTMAVVVGAVCGAAAATTGIRVSNWSTSLAVLTPRTAALAMIVLLANAAMGLKEVSAASVARDAAKGVPQLDAADAWSDAEVESRLERLHAAATARPDDAELHRTLADVLIYRFRRRAFQTLKDSPTDPSLNEAALWNLTAPTMLHERANAFHNSGNSRALVALRKNPTIEENLGPALAHLRAARRACPILPRVDLKLAALAFVDAADSPAGEDNWRRAVLLTPSDPEVLTQAGLLALNAGREDEACRHWRRSLELTPRYEKLVLQLARRRLTVGRLVDDVLPARPEYLVELAARESQTELRMRLLEKADGLIESAESRLPPAEWHHLHGVLDRMQHRPQQAASHLRRAVELKPHEIDWRVELVNALRGQGRLDEARREATLCAAMAPDRKDIQELLRELVRAPLMESDAARDASEPPTSERPSGKRLPPKDASIVKGDPRVR